MKDFLVYLAGPIKGFTYDGCTEWREYVRDEVHPSILTCSPMRGKEFIQDLGQVIGETYEDFALSTGKGINTRDFFDVERSDAVFVNFLGSKAVSIGTVMEVAWCRAFSKPVVCVMEKANIHRHTMLEYACGYVVEDLDEGINILHALLLPDRMLSPTPLRVKVPKGKEKEYEY